MAHYLVAHMERTGAVVASYATLAKITGMSVATVRRALDDLKADRWIEVVQIGGKGGANAYVINSRVAWALGRDKLHMAAFTARVIADAGEQPQIDDTPLRRIPTLHPGELQLPSGPGEDPPSQPMLEGMEPDLPTVQPPEHPDPWADLRNPSPEQAEALALERGRILAAGEKARKEPEKGE